MRITTNTPNREISEARVIFTVSRGNTTATNSKIRTELATLSKVSNWQEVETTDSNKIAFIAPALEGMKLSQTDYQGKHAELKAVTRKVLAQKLPGLLDGSVAISTRSIST